MEAELARAYAGLPDPYEGLNRMAAALTRKAATLRARAAELEEQTDRPGGWAASTARELEGVVERITTLIGRAGAGLPGPRPAHRAPPEESEWTYLGTVRHGAGWADLYYDGPSAPAGGPSYWVRTGPRTLDRTGVEEARVAREPEAWGLAGWAYRLATGQTEKHPAP